MTGDGGRETEVKRRRTGDRRLGSIFGLPSPVLI
jgi:hypothetical protein